MFTYIYIYIYIHLVYVISCIICYFGYIELCICPIVSLKAM